MLIGCEEVRNCRKERNGWTRGWVRCDYCTCDCIKKKYPAKYTMTNVKYDMSHDAVNKGKPESKGQVTARNEDTAKKDITKEEQYDYVKETSVESSKSLEVGSTLRLVGHSRLSS